MCALLSTWSRPSAVRPAKPRPRPSPGRPPSPGIPYENAKSLPPRQPPPGTIPIACGPRFSPTGCSRSRASHLVEASTSRSRLRKQPCTLDGRRVAMGEGSNEYGPTLRAAFLAEAAAALPLVQWREDLPGVLGYPEESPALGKLEVFFEYNEITLPSGPRATTVTSPSWIFRPRRSRMLPPR